MEKWITYHNIGEQIELIERFEGGNQELKVYYTDKKKRKWMLHFDFVWDFRYAIENAFINRCYYIKQDKTRIKYSSIYIVEGSEYIKYFEDQTFGSLPTDELKHFLIFDAVDSGLEILTTKEPERHEIGEGEK